jgi:hypothetical protein
MRERYLSPFTFTGYMICKYLPSSTRLPQFCRSGQFHSLFALDDLADKDFFLSANPPDQERPMTRATAVDVALVEA